MKALIYKTGDSNAVVSASDLCKENFQRMNEPDYEHTFQP